MGLHSLPFLGTGSILAPTAPPAGAVFRIRGDLGITAVGSKASVQVDQVSGNNPVQATDAQRPTINPTGINGKQTLTYVRASGTNMVAPADPLSAGVARTIFAVIKSATAAGGTILAFRKSNNSVIFTLNDGTPGTSQFVAGTSAVDDTVIGVPNPNGVPLLLEWRWGGNGKTVEFLANGVQYAVSGGALASESGTTGLVIGNRLDFATFGMNGEHGEKVIYAGLLPWSAARKVRNYVKAYWGIDSTAAKTRFVPIGDSITLGTGDLTAGGYRVGLVTDHPGLLGVGSITGPGALKHEGIAGQTSADVLARTTTAYTNNPGDVVLLHVGTNDYIPPLTASQTATNVVGIVNAIKAVDPAARIFVALIINSTAALTARNALYVQQRAALTTALSGVSGVTLVQMPTLLDAEFSDTEHPNTAGYARMNVEGWEPALTASGL